MSVGVTFAVTVMLSAATRIQRHGKTREKQLKKRYSSAKVARASHTIVKSVTS